MSSRRRRLRGRDRAGPDPRRLPDDARRRDDPQRARVACGLDPRPTTHQAGEQDACPPARRRPAAGAPRLPGADEVVATVIGRRELEQLESTWAEKRGLKTFFTTVDHKKI